MRPKGVFKVAEEDWFAQNGKPTLQIMVFHRIMNVVSSRRRGSGWARLRCQATYYETEGLNRSGAMIV